MRGKFLARFRRSVVPSIAWVATLALVASLLVAGTTPATAQQAPYPTPSVDPLAPFMCVQEPHEEFEAFRMRQSIEVWHLLCDFQPNGPLPCDNCRVIIPIDVREPL